MTIDSTAARRYEDQGFLVLEGVFAAKELAALRNAAARVIDEFDPGRHRTVFSTTDRDAGRDDYFFESAQRVHCFLEEESVDAEGRLLRPKAQAVNKIGHALHDHVPGFRDFCRQPLIGDTLRALGYGRPLLWQTMYIFKQPEIGGVVRWHQDGSYLITDPPSVVGFWVALEDATRDNGCLWLAPGAHRGPLRERYTVDWNTREGRLDTLDDAPWPTREEAVAAEVPAGSLVIFHDHMPHYSAPNRSSKSRQAFTMHFADASSEWSPQNWLQRPMLGAFEV